MFKSTQRNIVSLIVVALFVFGLVFAVGTPRAQAQETPGTTCDSTLILLLFIAQRDYGFTPTTDVTGFEFGQFRPWFDMMPPGGEPAATEPAGEAPAATEPAGGEPMATEPAGGEPAATEPAGGEPAATEPAGEAPMATEPAGEAPAATEPAGEPGVILSPGMVVGEDPICTQLRQELENFFFLGFSGGTLTPMGGQE